MTVRLYIAAVDGLSIPDALDAVTAKRREKALGLRNDGDKRRCLGAALLMYRAVNGGVPFDPLPGEHGKPRLEGGPCFSLSHSGDYAVCAVSEHELGVDIEKARPGSARLAERCLTVSECGAVLQAEAPDELFCEYWVKKESYVKALGTGLATPLRSFEVGERIGEYSVRHLTYDGYHIAVCVRGEIGELELYDKETV